MIFNHTDLQKELNRIEINKLHINLLKKDIADLQHSNLHIWNEIRNYEHNLLLNKKGE